MHWIFHSPINSGMFPLATLHVNNISLSSCPFAGRITLWKSAGLQSVSGGTFVLRENVPEIKLHRYNKKFIWFKLKIYGNNAERSFKNQVLKLSRRQNSIKSSRADSRQGREDFIEGLKNDNYYIFIDYKVLHIKIMRNL